MYIKKNKQSRRESENKLSRLIDDKFGVLRSELAKESRIRAENISLINNTLEVLFFQILFRLNFFYSLIYQN